MASSSVADRVQAIAERVAIDHGLELVHAEVAGPDNKPIVRIFIDKPNGVTHQDCSEVSLHVGTVLDVEDFIHASYTLEVSSPGIERPLRNARDFRRFTGRDAVVTADPGQDSPELSGKEVRIAGVEGDDGSEIVMLEDAAGTTLRVPLAAIRKARLAFNWKR